jgi:hypothetical protein
VILHVILKQGRGTPSERAAKEISACETHQHNRAVAQAIWYIELDGNDRASCRDKNW